MPLSRPRRRARLSMTSLIDVIFLLLLFFMLSSTFSDFAEVELSTGGTGGGDTREVVFLRLGADEISVNGMPVTLDGLAETLATRAPGPATALLSVTAETDAQRLTDALMALRRLPEFEIVVLGAP